MTEEVSLFYKQRLWHSGDGIALSSSKFFKYDIDPQRFNRYSQLTCFKNNSMYLSDPLAPIPAMRQGITLCFSTTPSIHSSFPGRGWAVLHTSIHSTRVEFHYKTKWAVETTIKS